VAFALLGLVVVVVAAAAATAGVLLLAGATFAQARWLPLAWAAPLAVIVLEGAARIHRARARSRFGAPGAASRLVQDQGRGLRFARAACAAIALMLLGVAAARPQWGTTEEEVARRGVDVFACVDVSRSMLAEDVTPNRLERAKLALASFLDRVEGNRVALVAFAGEARLSCPPTTDLGAVRLFLELLDADVLQQPGTALAPPLRLISRLVPQGSERNVAVVLFTDGEDLEGDFVEAAKELAGRGIAVHAVAVGRPEGAPIPVEDAGDGRPGYLRDGEGKTVMSRMDVTVLQQVTQATGGILQAASSDQSELGAIAAAIASMEQGEGTSRRTRTRTDRYLPFLAAGFALLALELLLPDGARILGRRGSARTTRLMAAARRTQIRTAGSATP
jgi:Ca-activated chloride channel family protein